MAPGAVPDGEFRPSGLPGAGAGAGVAAVAALVATPDIAPGPSGPPGAGRDHHLGAAGAPSLGPGSAPDLETPGSGLESALETPFTPRSEVSHSPCSVVGPDAADLKSTAPEAVGPRDGVRIAEPRATLTVRNARGRFAEDATFRHVFALYKLAGNRRMEVEVGCGTPLGADSTTYRVATQLDLEASYEWRARAVFDGAYGPWSEEASFQTVAVRLGAPRPLVPGADATVPISTAFTVRNPRVDGNPDRVFIEVEVATDAGFTSRVATGRTRMRDRGETDVTLNRALEPSERYHWRARATASAGAAGEVAGPWSDGVRFRTSALRLTKPRPIAPRNRAVDVPIRPRPSNPQFTVRNATGSAGAGGVNLQLEVARDDAFANVVSRGEGEQRPRGETNIWIKRALMPETQYYWRVRARLAADPSVVSDWSAVWSFTTGTEDAGPTTGPPRGQCCPPRNRSDILERVVRATGSLYRRDVQQFTQRVAECLAVTDGDWGRRRNPSGTIGKDTVAYRTSKGPGSGPYSIDILLGAAGDNPIPRWAAASHDGIKGRIGGKWVAVDGSGCILGSVSAP